MRKAAREVRDIRVRLASREQISRLVPEEVPVALVFDGSTHAVMMATPRDLEDFAIGFAMTEGVISGLGDIRELDIVDHDGEGIECRLWLSSRSGEAQKGRRRRLAGPTGCGLCGIESLEEAVPAPRKVKATRSFSPVEVMKAMEALSGGQVLNARVRALHAAGFWTPEAGLVAVTEDVGRHNALDKLVGRLARCGIDGGQGMIVLTSRVSVEMVQKAVVSGAGLLVAVSAPTALALDVAEKAGLTLAAVARSDGFELFTHPERIAAVEPFERVEQNVA